MRGDAPGLKSDLQITVRSSCTLSTCPSLHFRLKIRNERVSSTVRLRNIRPWKANRHAADVVAPVGMHACACACAHAHVRMHAPSECDTCMHMHVGMHRPNASRSQSRAVHMPLASRAVRPPTYRPSPPPEPPAIRTCTYACMWMCTCTGVCAGVCAHVHMPTCRPT